MRPAAPAWPLATPATANWYVQHSGAGAGNVNFFTVPALPASNINDPALGFSLNQGVAKHLDRFEPSRAPSKI